MTQRAEGKGRALGRLGALLLVSGLASACMNPVADHCSACTVVKEAQRPQPQAASLGTRTLVVLVHGAFGFGREWEPVVAALRRSPSVSFVVFQWRGPFHDLTGTVADLTEVVQRALDQSPALTEVLILAHSAGGPLATRAALRLHVPDGRRVELAEIDSPAFINGRPFFRDRLHGTPEMPPGVDRVVYRAARAPRASAVADPHRVYLGPSVSHNQAVALVGLPLIAQLAARALADARAGTPSPDKETTWLHVR